jgi:WD40 repeat protein
MDGSVQVVRVLGSMNVHLHVLKSLSKHSEPVLFLNESPDGLYLTSTARDELLYVWKHNSLTK